MSKKAALWLIVGIVVAIAAVSIVSLIFWGPEEEVAYIYVTTEGFGAGKDVSGKLLAVTPGESIADIFSMKYQEYYEYFGKPLIRNNEFVEFLGAQKKGSAKIRVYVDDVLTLDIEQAFLGTDCNVKIVYQK